MARLINSMELSVMGIDFGYPGHPISSSLGFFSREAQSCKEQPGKRRNSILGCFESNMGKVFLVLWSCGFYLPEIKVEMGPNISEVQRFCSTSSEGLQI